MNMEKKNPFVFFHGRQMLGLIIMLIFSNITEKYVNSWIGTGFWFVTMACWVYGIVMASTGKTNPLPIFGNMFQKWFANLK